MSIMTAEKYPEHLETLAIAAGARAIADADRLFDEYQAEHLRQVEGWSFECRRFGEFLTLHIGRGGNPDKPAHQWHKPLPRKMSTTINLRLVRSIRLVQGRAPDREGAISFSYSLVNDDGYPFCMSSAGNGRNPPPKGMIYRVAGDAESVSYERPFLYFEPVERDSYDRVVMSYADEYQIKHRVSAYPRPAVDDRIVFEGFGTLLAPAGEGQATLSDILTELASEPVTPISLGLG